MTGGGESGYRYPRPAYKVVMSPEQIKRQDLQVDWLIAALQRRDQPVRVLDLEDLDLRSLDIVRVRLPK